MGLAGLYRRVATNRQDNSIEVQQALNTEYRRPLALSALFETYADPSLSGSIPLPDRVGGRTPITRLELGDVKHIVTPKRDRLGHYTLDSNAAIRGTRGLAITPHFTAEGGALPRTPQNELLFRVKASLAQYQRNLIRERA
jgi:DNA invertase Pin-like site-specific DNA recombinase